MAAACQADFRPRIPKPNRKSKPDMKKGNIPPPSEKGDTTTASRKRKGVDASLDAPEAPKGASRPSSGIEDVAQLLNVSPSDMKARLAQMRLDHEARIAQWRQKTPIPTTD